MINSAVKKKANPIRADKAEGFTSMRGASICPIAAPTIRKIMGKT